MGYIDMHSHILPGLDDGSKSVEQSIEMLKIANSQGISSIVATPHNMPGKGCPDSTLVRESVRTLQSIADKEDIPITIHMGTEYFFREQVLELLWNEQAIVLGKSECVLIEYDPMAERSYISNSLKDVLGTSYRPVLAHIERYIKMSEDIQLIRDLRKMGVLVQINAASVTGNNGMKVKKTVKKLLKEHLVDFVGTDAHGDLHRAPLIEKCADVLYRKYGSVYADALLGDRAEELGMVE